VRAVAAALRRWEADPDRPSKLVLPLAHYYTPAELSFGALKNGDAAITAVLLRAAASVGHVVRLAMISIWESGSAAETWDHRGRWDFEPDPDDFEVLEVYERTENVEGWVTPDGEPDHRGPLPLEEDELCPPGSLDDAMPDDQEYHEATGNAGATFERTYRHAALVVWPASAELELVLQDGLEWALRVLRQLIADGEVPRATRLAKMMVDSCPPAVRHTRSAPATCSPSSGTRS
jgi:hypothetical protein